MNAADKRFLRGQRRMLVTTIIGYTLFYFLRKNLALAMPGLAQDYGITKTSLGLFLTLPGTPEEEGMGRLALPYRLARRVYLNPTMWVLGASCFMVYLARFAILDWGPMLMKEAKGVSLAGAGWTVATFEIAGILGTLFSGVATDRLAGGRAPRVCLFMMLGANTSCGGWRAGIGCGLRRQASAAATWGAGSRAARRRRHSASTLRRRTRDLRRFCA